MMIEMMKKNKRSYFKLVEDRKHKARVRNLLKYIPKQTKLIKFLIDNKADEGFIEGLKLSSTHTRKRVFNYECRVDTINLGFVWSATEEGYDYWYMLNYKFIEEYRGDNEQPRTNLC